MTDERWSRIRHLFHRAADLPTAERASFLARECGDDHELRTELELMLSAADEEDTLIREVIGQQAAELAYGDREIPSQIGPYRLLHELGSGGMGRVWLAERSGDDFRQRVAIKLVTESFKNHELLLRFRGERQILANLEHPNIARLLDGGTAGKLPYVVMEYVDGVPITDYCAERGLGIRQRLELFRKACTAVEFAHQNLVVHRDIKPANLLVTPTGEPKLLDFGIAKLLDPKAAGVEDAVQTMAAARMMTPAYASPEQVKGKQITTATDVYSLGVLLFELLTGARPFQPTEGESYFLQKAICEDDPPRPSSLCAGLSRDLDAIVFKAMRKNPSDRYASVERLSEDVRRYLAHYPVRARQGDWQYRSFKFFQRHKAVAPVSVAFLTVIGLALLGLTVQSRKTAEQRDRAVAAQSAAEKAREAAEAQRILAENNQRAAEAQRARAEEAEARASAEAGKAREEANTASRVAAFLEGLFRDADPTHTNRGDLSAREMLQRGAMRMSDELASDPVIRGRLGEVVGGAYTELGDYDAAENALTDSLQLRRKEFGDRHPETVGVLRKLGVLFRIKGEVEKSQQFLEQALAIERTAQGRRSIAAGRILLELGETLISRSRHAEAEAALDEAYSIFEAAPDRNTADLREALRLKASVAIRLGKQRQSVDFLRRAVALAREQHGQGHIDVAKYLNPLGAALRQTGRLEEAEVILREAHDIYVRVLGERHASVANNLSNRAAIAYARAHYPQAADFFAQSLSIYREVNGERHPIVARLINNIAVIRYQMRDFETAQSLYTEALSITEQTLGVDSVDYADALNNLGRTYLALRDFPKALQILGQALELRKRVQGERHPLVAVTLDGLGICRRELGNHAAAEVLHRQSLEIRRAALSAGHPGISVPLLGIGLCRIARSDPQGAVAVLREGLDIRRKALPAGHWEIAEMESALGAALGMLGQTSEANTLLHRSYDTLRQKQGSDSAITRQAARWIEDLQAARRSSAAQRDVP